MINKIFKSLIFTMLILTLGISTIGIKMVSQPKLKYIYDNIEFGYSNSITNKLDNNIIIQPLFIDYDKEEMGLVETIMNNEYSATTQFIFLYGDDDDEETGLAEPTKNKYI